MLDLGCRLVTSLRKMFQFHENLFLMPWHLLATRFYNHLYSTSVWGIQLASFTSLWVTRCKPHWCMGARMASVCVCGVNSCWRIVVGIKGQEGRCSIDKKICFLFAIVFHIVFQHFTLVSTSSIIFSPFPILHHLISRDITIFPLI
jgi:hypothetical protein